MIAWLALGAALSLVFAAAPLIIGLVSGLLISVMMRRK
jgi:hypothetical protein